MKYLKADQDYCDLYDRLTIEECLDWEKSFLKGDLDKYEGKKLTRKQSLHLKQSMTNLMLYFIKGEKFKKKTERIREWMDKARIEQDKYDNTPEPQGIFCPQCGELMHCTLKDLQDFTKDPLRMLFFFDCSHCKNRQAIYDNGEEYISKPEPCPKCSSDLVTTYKRKGKVITTVRKCTSCGYLETKVDDLDKKDDTWEKKKAKDRQLLTKYRAKYCLSEKEGNEYVISTDQLKLVVDMFKEQEQKEADPAYHKAKQLKKLSVIELEKLLNKFLEKEKYIRLSFDKPEIDRHVIVPFTVQDSDSFRKESDSRKKLQQLIKGALEDTNWRLMTEGTSYRLGYVYGRLRGYEQEEDLMEIVRKKNENRPLMETENGPIY